MSNSYQNRFTWSYFEKSGRVDALIHTDQSVSVALTWEGIKTTLEAEARIQSIYSNMNDAFQEFPDDVELVIENHFLRDYSEDTTEKYLEYGRKNIVRNHKFAMKIREEMASLISNITMKNRVLMVITIARKLTPFAIIFPKRAIKKTSIAVKQLGEIAKQIMVNFEDAKLLSHQEFDYEIWRHYHRDRARENTIPNHNSRFRISNRVAEKPTYENGLMKLGKTFTKVILLTDYPDASINWFYCLANQSGVEMHVTQIVKPLDMARAVLSSASQTKKAADGANKVGGESVQEKVKDHNQYRSFIAANKLHVYNNAYIIKMHHIDPEYLNERSREIIKSLGKGTILATESEKLSFAMWRVSQLGQGHKSPFLRADHTLQVVNMAPIINFSITGSEHQMLRMTQDLQAIPLAYPTGGTNHAITAAKTGAGKGVETVTQVAELYPLGINFYIAEVGASEKWVVEAFGGDYFHLSPETVISPFPDFSMADREKDNPLAADIVSPTIAALMPLIGDGGKGQIQHIESVGEQIMSELYRHDAPDGLKAPTLATFYDCAEQSVSSFSGAQSKAAKIIVENLDSFLASIKGEHFAKADTINFNSGIVGVDFKPLMNNEKLAKFILVFVALRYKQLAFANATPTRIIIDELHEFSRIDPELITVLIQQLTRMGRKEAGAFHGITQETLDAALEKGILNQITHRHFMYLQDNHEETAEIFKMNDNVLARWKRYKDPEAPGANMNYRECMRQYGKSTYDLYLKYPKILLDLAHSSAEALALKHEIGKKTREPLERLHLFAEAMKS